MTYCELIKKAFVQAGHTPEKAEEYMLRSQIEKPEFAGSLKEECPPEMEQGMIEIMIKVFQNPAKTLKILDPIVEADDRERRIHNTLN